MMSLLPRRPYRLCLLLLPLLIVALAWAAPAVSQGTEPDAISAADLPQAIAAAAAGDEIIVDGGVYYGALHIDRPLTIIGRNRPVLDGQERGTVVTISAAGVLFEGFVIRGSGDSLDQENSGLVVEAPDVTIAGNVFEETLFGIYLREAHGGVVRDNVIRSKDLAVPRRGDPIRVWFSNDVTISGNQVLDGRDVLLWYSQRLTLKDNDVSGGRYGLHFMYCDDAFIAGNRLYNNSVGAFLMYSRRLTMEHNSVAMNRGPSGYGVGLKDLDDAIVRHNNFLDNRVGAYLDGTPREVDSIGLFEGNVFAYNDIGIELMPAVARNQFIANSFIDNQEQVALAGGGNPGVNHWTVDGVGNYWSNYAGFDADGDGHGDISFVSERLYEDLMQRQPALRLYLYSPATDALDFAARAFPVVRPQPKLEDSSPLMAPRAAVGAPALPTSPGNAAWFVLAFGLSVLSYLLIGLPRLQKSRYVLPQSSPTAAGAAPGARQAATGS